MEKTIVTCTGKRMASLMAVMLLLMVAGTAFSDCKNAQCASNKSKLNSAKQCVNCDLSFADLRNGQLNRANLEGANLSYADLRGADLSAANLKKANLSYADLRGANLRGANLGNPVLVAANLSDAIWIDGLKCRDGSIGSCKR